MMLNATIMSKHETSRDYSLRSVGKCTKYYAHSCDNPKEAVGCDSFETPPCMNCKSLSIDNDKLRRQIAILKTYIDKQSINTDSAVAGSPKGDVKSTQSQTPCIMLKNTSCGTDTPVKSVFPGTSVASGTSDNSHMITLSDGDCASDSHVNGISQPIPPPVKDVRKTNAKSSCNSDQESTQKTNRDRVLYISSSMFKSLDETRLSSKSTDALVFSYPGATVSSIEEKFRGDKRISHVDPNTIKTIILMCGTNNVDSILGSPKHMRDKLLSEKTPYSCDMESMSETFQSIEHFLVYLNKWAPYAKIKVLNILPRESKARNEVITRINSYIFSLAQRFAFVEHPDSMANRSYLFAYKSGFRKSIFFSSYGSDNVHLNQKGVTRLARYLKYIAHNH
ncbi:hypothetical protein ACHWQZ_G013808 [Mnemiopsis leidyi]